MKNKTVYLVTLITLTLLAGCAGSNAGMDMSRAKANGNIEKTARIPEPIALVDKNSALIRVNKAMAKLLGAHPTQVIGKECYLSTNGFNNKKQAMVDHTALLRGRHLSGKFIGKDGSKVYEVSISPYYDHTDRVVIGAVYVARNITGR